ncbi:MULTISPECIES: MarR family winged helix-turn-helix transcriptional regulator [unclassified Bradyrhizobium]|uniref:MarR family winged helix-turn-helix transcriptional regulator n=1 Tax=unclassified Bradyrhizobium TaxID=2631580 RepID=UPI0029163AAC|nr:MULTISPECIES: MarR family transcriptional regulator [unclassified Bradyrhizobium]
MSTIFRIGSRDLCWQSITMKKAAAPRRHQVDATPELDDGGLAPITAIMSSRIIVLANLLRRGAVLRYKRLVGLSSVEFGILASLGRRRPISVAKLAASVGMDKGQISRALAELVRRGLICKTVNEKDTREILVSLSQAGRAVHDTILSAAVERNRRLLKDLSKEELQTLQRLIERLTTVATEMLADEQDS